MSDAVLFQYVLGIRVKDQVTFDRTSWLKPNERGSAAHEVYRRYMTEVSANKIMPITHDHALLLRIAEETILLYAERIPAPSPHVFERERQSMLRDIEVFYRMELQANTAPVFEKELIVDGQPLHLELGEDMAITRAESSTGSIKLRRINIELLTIRPAVLGLTRKMACSQAARGATRALRNGDGALVAANGCGF